MTEVAAKERTRRATRGAGESRRSAESRASRRALLRFVLRFAGGWALALLVLAWVPLLEQWAVSSTMANLLFVLRALPVESTAVGTQLRVGTVSVLIAGDCTPLMPVIGLWCAVAAFPSRWRWKVVGMIAGAAAIWLYNLLRVLAMIGILAWRPGWFEFTHVYLWQTVTILVMFALLVTWVRLGRPAAAAP